MKRTISRDDAKVFFFLTTIYGIQFSVVLVNLCTTISLKCALSKSTEYGYFAGTLELNE